MLKIENNELDYPFLLKRLINPPNQLYIEGNKDILNNNMIAVVGSRGNTEYGERWGEFFCNKLLDYNLNIVSGMALGIDSVAHWTCIKAGVPTIAVLPCGFDNIYPKKNMDLFKAIIDSGGAVVSEYDPEVKANSGRFIERNRIVAGLSMGVFVVEAAFRSGTSITARIAKDNGKPVFCIPGSLDNIKSVGTNNLIKEGAFIVTDVEDIVSHFSFLKKVRNKRKNKVNDTIKLEYMDVDKNSRQKHNNLKKYLIDKETKIDEKYRKIYELIPKEGININDMIIQNNLDLAETMEKITMLEIMGKVKRKAGNRYSRT